MWCVAQANSGAQVHSFRKESQPSPVPLSGWQRTGGCQVPFFCHEGLVSLASHWMVFGALVPSFEQENLGFLAVWLCRA